MKAGTKILIAAVIIIILGLAAYIGGRRFEKLNGEISFLKGENSSLKTDIKARDNEIKKEKDRADSIVIKLQTLQADYVLLEREKIKIARDLEKALAELNHITTDSSYIFLQKVAYNFPGTLRYLFNELQVRGIHRTFVELQSSNHMISTLENEIENCNKQVEDHEKLKASLENMISNLNENADDYEKIVAKDSVIIRDQGKLIKKTNRRKNFWETTTGALGLVVIGMIL